jgi:hypothetical protein
MLYLFINVNIFMIYCCFKFLFNFILETLHSFDVILRKSSHVYIGKNNIVFLCKSLIVIELLI